MYVETVHSIDTHFQKRQRIFPDLPGRCAQDGDIHFPELLHIFHDRNTFQFRRAVLVPVPSYYSGYFEIRRDLQCLYHIFADIPISDNGCFNLFHLNKFNLYIMQI